MLCTFLNFKTFFKTLHLWFGWHLDFIYFLFCCRPHQWWQSEWFHCLLLAVPTVKYSVWSLFFFSPWHFLLSVCFVFWGAGQDGKQARDMSMCQYLKFLRSWKAKCIWIYAHCVENGKGNSLLILLRLELEFIEWNSMWWELGNIFFIQCWINQLSLLPHVVMDINLDNFKWGGAADNPNLPFRDMIQN